MAYSNLHYGELYVLDTFLFVLVFGKQFQKKCSKSQLVCDVCDDMIALNNEKADVSIQFTSHKNASGKKNS